MFSAQAAEAATDPLQVAAITAAATFLAAVVAVALGQWWQSKREDKRWQREQDQEKVRWERESEERRKAHNFEDRKAAYIEYLQFLDPWRDLGNEITRGREQPVDREKLDEYWETGRSFLVRISVLAPPEVHDHARRVSYDFYNILVGSGWAEGTAMDHLFATQGRYNRMLQAFREDIGVETEPAYEPRVHAQEEI